MSPISGSVRLERLLVPLIQFSNHRRQVRTITVLDDDHQVRIRGEDFVKEMWESLGKRRGDVPELDEFRQENRETFAGTLQMPKLHVRLNHLEFDENDLPDEGGTVGIDAANFKSSIWWDLADTFIRIFNSVIKSLYWESGNRDCLDELLTLLPPSGGLVLLDRSTFPFCLSRWNPRLKVSSEEWIEPDFSVESDGEEDFRRGFEAPTMGDGAPTWRRNLKSVIGEEADDWRPWEEYVIRAERYYNDDDFRHAILELDIACDLVVNSWIPAKSELPNDAFDRISDKATFGNLIMGAKLLCSNEEAEDRLDKIKELHDIRNQIIHNYQRSIDETHKKAYQEALVALNELAAETFRTGK